MVVRVRRFDVAIWCDGYVTAASWFTGPAEKTKNDCIMYGLLATFGRLARRQARRSDGTRDICGIPHCAQSRER
jgi:hypothetical protein